ncbi:hypothetical protein vseg_001262 [Gypsophila vaccaria]
MALNSPSTSSPPTSATSSPPTSATSSPVSYIRRSLTIEECLHRRGYLTKKQIAKFTDLPNDKVTKCLWVLIQHNRVQAFALEQQGVGRETTEVVTHYMVVLNNIIHRLSTFLSWLQPSHKSPLKQKFIY